MGINRFLLGLTVLLTACLNEASVDGQVLDFDHTLSNNGWGFGSYDAAAGSCPSGLTRMPPADIGASSGNGFTACVD